MAATENATILPHNQTHTDGGNTVSIDNLYPAIVQCFAIILFGYMAGRMNIVSTSQGKGIGTFVSKFCLPALLFQNMCTLDFSVVDWKFLSSVLISKSLIFALVFVVTIVARRPINYGLAGLFAIFCTQSNDFALGYPILQALYQESHPEYLNYIYLIAPVSVVILNPIGFLLLEIQKKREGGLNESQHGSKSGTCALTLHVIKGVLTNPIVFMTVIGIVGNFVLNRHIPIVVLEILKVLGNAFSGTALFYLGLSLVGKVSGQMGPQLIVPVLLIVAKALIMPLVTWEVVGALEKTSDNTTESMSMFGFLYGTFPTAPSVFLYASHYSVGQDIVATGMVAGTFLSAPIMFVSAKMMTVVVNNEMDYKSLMLETSFDTSIISLVCSVWVIILMFLSGRYKKVPHQFLICFCIAHVLSCLGMILYEGSHSNTKTWLHYIQFTFILVGVLSARCWTAVISLVLYFLHCRSLCFVLRIRWWLFLFAFMFPMFCTGLLILLGSHHMKEEIDPSFHYGVDQTILSLVVLILCSTVNIVSLIMKQRNSIQYNRLRGERSGKTLNGKSKRQDGSGGQGDKCCLLSGEQDEPGENDYMAINSNCNDCDSKCTSRSKPINTCIEDIVPFPKETESLISETSSSSSDGLSESIESQTCVYGSCGVEQRRQCAGLLRKYNTSIVNIPEEDVIGSGRNRKVKDDYQTNRFILMLVLCQISMFMGLFLCTWRLFNKITSGTYVEVEFLDGVMNYGQGFIVFAIFGFDTRLIFLPCIKSILSLNNKILRRWRKLVYGVEVVTLPDAEDLDDDTRHLCEQFRKYHKTNCFSSIVKDLKYRLKEYKQVFTGTDMCDWLIEVGLAHDRTEAIEYGCTLLTGHMISHVTNEHHFHDLPYFYHFIEDEDDDL